MPSGHRLDAESNGKCESAGGSRGHKSPFTYDCDQSHSHFGFGFDLPGTQCGLTEAVPVGIPDEKGRTDWGRGLAATAHEEPPWQGIYVSHCQINAGFSEPFLMLGIGPALCWVRRVTQKGTGRRVRAYTIRWTLAPWASVSSSAAGDAYEAPGVNMMKPTGMVTGEHLHPWVGSSPTRLYSPAWLEQTQHFLAQPLPEAGRELSEDKGRCLFYIWVIVHCQ